MSIKSSRFVAGCRGIRRLGSAFMTLRWPRLAHICFQVTSLHIGEEVELINNYFNRKSISRNTTHPQCRNLQWMLTGKMFKAVWVASLHPNNLWAVYFLVFACRSLCFDLFILCRTLCFDSPLAAACVLIYIRSLLRWSLKISPGSTACRFRYWGWIKLRELDFLCKNFVDFSTSSPLWRLVAWKHYVMVQYLGNGKVLVVTFEIPVKDHTPWKQGN